MRWVLKPSQCILPMYRACSTLMQRSMTTVTPPSSAILAASKLMTPNWHQRAPAWMATVSRAMPGRASGARKTFTMSTGSGTSCSRA